MKFVGRDEALANLHQQLQQTERVAITAVAGMSGVGKTELALQYALHHWEQSTYPGGVCWLRVRNEDVGIQILQFARQELGLQLPEDLDLPAKINYCWRQWPEGEVLVVLDDVSTYQQVEAYLPPSLPKFKFKVLITTRVKWLGESFQQLSLKVLDETPALDLLVSYLGDERIKREIEEAKQLCADLGFLPLGLELVGRYLKRKNNLSLAQMRERLGLKHRSLTETSPEMTAKRGVQAAFELSWQELDKQAQQLACLLSVFALAPIPWNLVEQCLADVEAEDLEDLRDDFLVNLSLLEDIGGESYQLHQLIREFMRGKREELTDADELKRDFCRVVVAVAQEIPQTPTQEQIASFTLDIPHLGEAATVQQNSLSDEDLIWPFVGLGRLYEGQGAYQQALPWREQCLSIARKRLGESHPSVASSLNNLAGLYKSQGRYSEAEPLYIQALELSKRLLGESHPDIATSLNNLAGLYYSQGKYSEAEVLYIQTLELSKRLLGESHPDVASSLNNLAALYTSQGKYSEAKPLYIQALELRKRLLGESHPDVATSLNNLAGLYEFQGKYSEAEFLYIQALELRKRLLGESHPDVASSLNNMAALYTSQGKYSEAEVLYIQALELSKRLLGESHPNVAASLNNLALLYYFQGKYSEAEPLYIQALKLSKRLLGESHPDVATSLNNLAFLYNSQGKYSDAEPLFIQALELRKSLLGESHPNIAASLNNLARLYYSQGRYSEAEPLYIQALKLIKRLLVEAHPDVATSLNNLALLYNSQGRYSEAEPLYIQALELKKRLLGESHPSVATSLNNLAGLYYFQGKYSEAKLLYIQALEIAELRLGINHPNTITFRKSLQYLRDTHQPDGNL
ncbi:tetratricopeptide repeat protein [Cylindrospermum stagnale]